MSSFFSVIVFDILTPHRASFPPTEEDLIQKDLTKGNSTDSTGE